jgi:rootletin
LYICIIIKFLCFKDDFKTQVLSAKKQLQEAQELHNKVDAKLNTALHNVRAVQEEKGTLEAKLGQKQAILQAQVKKQ